MLKTRAFLICFLFIGFIGTSKAEPPDTPDVVRIDGQPCNQACQSYMAWSRAVSGRGEVPAAPASPPQAAEVQPAAKNIAKKPAPDRVARENTPKPDPKRPVPKAQLARTDGAGAKLAAPHIATAPPTRSAPEKAVEQARLEQAKSELAKSAQTKPEQTKAIAPVQDLTGTIPDAKPATVPDTPPTTGTATATEPVTSVPATPGQTAAVPPTETPPNPATAQQPPAEKPEQAASVDIKRADTANATAPDNAKTMAAASPNAEPLVAVLLVRKEIKSVSDLANKIVAIDASDAVSRTKTAFVSAGATDVQLSEGDRMALLRVMDGEVQAAVVTLESPQKAAAWTEVPGFNVLRLPLAPAAEKEGPG
jgi:hypothetical protein